MFYNKILHLLHICHVASIWIIGLEEVSIHMLFTADDFMYPNFDEFPVELKLKFLGFWWTYFIKKIDEVIVH